MNVDLQSVDLSLNYVTHDARNILKTIGDKGITLYWQVRLMELCYNYNFTVVLSTIQDIDKRNPGTPPRYTIEQAMPRVGKPPRKQYHNAMFTDEAIVNLFTLDRAILVSDYTTRLDDLASALHQLDKNDIQTIIGDIHKTNIGLLLLKIEEYIGAREREWKASRKRVDFKLDKISTTSEESMQVLHDTIEDLKGVNR